MGSLEERINAASDFTVKERLDLPGPSYDLYLGEEKVASADRKMRMWGIGFSLGLQSGASWGRVRQVVSALGFSAVVYDGEFEQVASIKQNVVKEALRNPLKPKSHLEIQLDGRTLTADLHSQGPLHLDVYEGSRLVGAIDQRDRLGFHTYAVHNAGSDARTLFSLTAMLDLLYHHWEEGRSRW